MSSSQLTGKSSERLAAMKEERIRSAKKEVTDAIRFKIIPQLSDRAEVGHILDITLGVDRKKIVVVCLRELADALEKGFD